MGKGTLGGKNVTSGESGAATGRIGEVGLTGAPPEHERIRADQQPDEATGSRALFAEFEVDLLRARTKEGMAVAKAKGKLRGKQPKLSPKQQAELRRMHDTGDYTITDLTELFAVSRPTVYRTLQRNTD